MSRSIIVIALFVLCAIASSAETSEDILNAQELLVSVDLSSTFDIISQSNNYAVDYIQANLTLFPKQTQFQDVRFTTLSPLPKVNDSSLVFLWESPEIGQHSFSAVADINVKRSAVPITRKVSFPIAELPSDVQRYTESTEFIDSDNSGIIALASELAEGEDDLFVVVHKLAAWSNDNIQYNLSTLTADVSLPASWVLANRQGVCDELTNLFIALNRALGIPARFVSGISYTNSELFPDQWGFHGWAEVYFPGHGWVPYDVTYGQFGFVDAGHVKMFDSVDTKETATNYQWRGRDIKVQTHSLTPKVTLKDIKGDADSSVTITSKVLKDIVGFGSYNLQELTVSNLEDHYVIADITHAQTEGLQLLENPRRKVLLKPHQTKTEYFTFLVSDDLKEDFIYTFPLSLRSGKQVITDQFKANRAARDFTEEEIDSLRIEEREEKTLLRSLHLQCRSDKTAYVHENVRILCEVANVGNVGFEGLSICYDESCTIFNLGISQATEFEFIKSFPSPGINRAKIKVFGTDTENATVVDIHVLDKPSLVLESFEYPQLVLFNDRFEVSFKARANSSSVPKNVHIVIEPTKASFDFGQIENSADLTAQLQAVSLHEGVNTLTVKAEYYDADNRKYITTEQIEVEVAKMSVYEKVLRFIFWLFD